MGIPTPSKKDGTEGTATFEMTKYKEGEMPLTHKVYGCIVKNDANLKGFIEEHIKHVPSADLVKFEKTKHFFYACGPNFNERAYEEFKVTCHRFSKSEPKSFALNSPPSGNIVRVGKHTFLLCDSKKFNGSTFLKEYRKKIKKGHNFNPNATEIVHGLSYKKGEKSPKFIPLKLSNQLSNVYDVDAKDHEKLIPAGPVLLKDKKTVVGRFIKKEENKISISFFGNDQVADEGSSASGVDNVVTEEHHIETDQSAASWNGAAGDSPPINQQPPGAEQPDGESTASRSGANISDSPATNQQPTGNQQSDDESGASGSGAETSDRQPPSNQWSDAKTDGPCQPIYNVYVSGNAQVAVGPNATVNTSRNYPNASNEEGSGDAENDDERAAGDIEGDQTDNNPVVVDVCREILATIPGQVQVDIRTVDCQQYARALAVHLGLDTTSGEAPPPETMKKCRQFCVALKQEQRLDIVEELKIILPNGMTGPLRDEMTMFQTLSVGDKKDLTRAMAGNDELLKTLVTELLGRSFSQTGFYLKLEDAAEKILDEFCKKRRLLVGELYDILVRYGGAPLADEYL